MVAMDGCLSAAAGAAILSRRTDGSGRTPGSGWAAMRPVLVAFLLVADAFVVAAHDDV